MCSFVSFTLIYLFNNLGFISIALAIGSDSYDNITPTKVITEISGHNITDNRSNGTVIQVLFKPQIIVAWAAVCSCATANKSLYGFPV